MKLARMLLYLIAVTCALASFAPSRASAQPGSWSSLQSPSRRAWASIVYDSTADQVLLFGGQTEFGNYPWDMWTLGRSGGWLSSYSSQSTADNRSAILDPVRRRIVIYGGRLPTGTSIAKVFVRPLDGTYFEQGLEVAGIGPSRSGSTAIYDPLRDRMIIFGGTDGATNYSDVWAISLSGTPTWSQVTALGNAPPVRSGATAIYDPLRDRMIIYGGYGGAPLGDTWALSLSDPPTWSVILPAGGPPDPRVGHVAVYDAKGDRMIVSGGLSSDYRNDTWALSFNGTPTWSEIALTGPVPSARFAAVGVYDRGGSRMLMAGGDGPTGYVTDCWALSLSGTPAWSAVSPGGDPPAGRQGHTAVYDPVRHQMAVFGGYAMGDQNDTEVLSLRPSGNWSRMSPLGTTPIARYGHSAVFDPYHDRMVVFGGCGSMGCPSSETWILKFAGTPTWSKLVTLTTPPARVYHQAIYDPRRDRMLVFGGAGSNNSYASGVWALSLDGASDWREVPTTGTPPAPRSGFDMILDPVRDRLIVYGGESTPSDDGVWALTLSEPPTWSRIQSVGGEGAPPQYQPSAIYDPVRDRMVIWGGNAGSGATWALDLSSTPAWEQFAPSGALTPPPRSWMTAIYDPPGDRMVIFSGSNCYTSSPPSQGDTWGLGWGNAVRPGLPCPGSVHATRGRLVGLEISVTNPLESDRAVQWSLTGPAAWSSIPKHGVLVVPGLKTSAINVDVQVPDSTAMTSADLTWSVAWAGGLGYDSLCTERVLLDSPTAAVVSLVKEDIGLNHVRFQWTCTQSGSLLLQRSSAEGAWLDIAQLVPGGNQIIEWDDSTVVTGRSYGYRLRAPSGDVIGTWWVDVPAVAALALQGIVPNPSNGPVSVRFSLPQAGTVRLEVIDVAGHRVATRTIFRDAGPQVEALETRTPLAAGVYFVRMSYNGRVLQAQGVVAR